MKNEKWLPYSRRKWLEVINMANNAMYMKTVKGRHIFHATPVSAKSTFENISAHYRNHNKVVMNQLRKLEAPYLVFEYEIYIEIKPKGDWGVRLAEFIEAGKEVTQEGFDEEIDNICKRLNVK